MTSQINFNFPQTALEVHQISVTHGFKHDNHAQLIALMHSELSEAFESDRNHESPYRLILEADFGDATIEGEHGEFNLTHKPVGWAVELIDCCIRIFDFYGYLQREKFTETGYLKKGEFIENGRGTDTGRTHNVYNKIRDGDATLPWIVTVCHNYISASFDIERGIIHNSAYLYDVIFFIISYLEFLGIAPKKIMSEKIEYNRQRPYRHGGKKC